MRTSTSKRWRRSISLAAFLALTAACGREADVVYVPGSGFRESLFISADRGPVVRAKVGEVITLSAQRRSGPWRAVPASEVAEGECALPTGPAELETEVADDLAWSVYPVGQARLNEEPREDRRRTVRFDAPGRYVMMAQSPSLCHEPFEGDTLVFEITR